MCMMLQTCFLLFSSYSPPLLPNKIINEDFVGEKENGVVENCFQNRIFLCFKGFVEINPHISRFYCVYGCGVARHIHNQDGWVDLPILEFLESQNCKKIDTVCRSHRTEGLFSQSPSSESKSIQMSSSNGKLNLFRFPKDI